MTKKQYQDISFEDFVTLRSATGTVVIDVREEWEFEEFNEGGINIPLANIRERRSELEDYLNIIVLCTNGTRSKVAAMDYCRVPEWSAKNIYHLKGGILEAE